MDLYPIPLDTVLSADSAALATGAEVRVRSVADDTVVTTYGLPTGGPPVPQPAVADAYGRITPRWVPAGAHKLVITSSEAEERHIPFTVGVASVLSPELSGLVVRTVNGDGPDEDGNVEVAGGSGGGATLLPFDQPGALAAVTGRGVVVLPSSQRITRVSAGVSTPPTGSAIRVDVNKNGVSIFGDQSQRPLIPDGGYASPTRTVDVACSAGDVLTVDIDQVGSAAPGANLGVGILLGQPAPPVPTAPTITSANADEVDEGQAFSHTVATTGYPAPALTFTGNLPAGVTFTDHGDGTATIAGTPSVDGTFAITITAANGTTPNGTQTYTLTVDAPFSFAGLPGYAEEWDVSTLSSADGTAVASIPSSGPGGHALAQATAGKRPVMRVAAQNGLRMIEFDGIDDALRGVFALGAPFTLYLVASITAGSLLDGQNQTTFGFTRVSDTRLYLSAGDTTVDVNPAPNVTTPRVIEIWCDGTATEVSVDDAPPAVDPSSNPTGLGGLSIANSGFDSYGAVKFGQGVLFTGALSNTNRAAAKSALASKWGIS